MTLGTLFQGFGGSDIGYHAAGFSSVWGVEYEDSIAAVARTNGLHALTANVQDRPWRALESVDALHLSPPCPNFSAAKVGGQETELDTALADACADAIRDICPLVVTIENVPAYAKSASFARLLRALEGGGYGIAFRVLNAADYGVPQTRKRLIALAIRGLSHHVVTLPPPTHIRGGETAGLFGQGRLPWVGWYAAVRDILHTLPDSDLAAWQAKRLPQELRTMLVAAQRTWADAPEGADLFAESAPAPTVTAGTHKHGWRVVLVGAGGFDGGLVQRGAADPAFTVTANSNQSNQVRAVLFDGQNSGQEWGKGYRIGDEPAHTLMASTGSRPSHLPRAVLVDGKMNDQGRSVTWRESQDPAMTLTASAAKQMPRAVLEARVVQITPRGLARFQSFPDTYALPDARTLACRGIGNAVPPLLMRRVAEHAVALVKRHGLFAQTS